MIRVCWQFRTSVDTGRSVFRRTAFKLALPICGALLLCGVAEAADNGNVGTGVLKACLSQLGDPIPVDFPDADGIFANSAGQRFFATDIQAEPSRDQTDASAFFRNFAGASVRIEAVPAGPPNRWGLIPAWLILRDGDQRQLLQAARLAAGMAVFTPTRAKSACAEQLRRAERSARLKKSGFWAGAGSLAIYPTANPQALEARTGHYVIARGRIVSLGKSRSTRYLNFGKFWKTDFTVTLKTSDEESFNAALAPSGWRIEDLEGKTVELRGVVQSRDGPLIALHHPEQLVVVENKRAGRDGRNSN